MTLPLLQCRELSCHRPLWREGTSHVRAISTEFSAGCFHAIEGSEGCGKNLLLHLLGLLEQPDSGEIMVGQEIVGELSVTARDTLRQREFGFLLPSCALLPSLSVLENIAFPILKSGRFSDNEQGERTLFALEFCELGQEAETPVGELPQAKQAATALARAIIHQPNILIAESPAAEEILVPLVRRAVDQWGLTVVWGARSGGPACTAADRRLAMAKGQLAIPQ